jgi:hypothetical protein
MTADRDRGGEGPIDPEQEIERTPAPPTPAADMTDPADEVPVPGAMSPAEIDERAQVVEALRNEREPRERKPVDDAMREPDPNA